MHVEGVPEGVTLARRRGSRRGYLGQCLSQCQSIGVGWGNLLVGLRLTVVGQMALRLCKEHS